jgi:hypothetical protein
LKPLPRRAIVLLGGLLGLEAAAWACIGIRFEAWYGPQKINDAKIRAVYGETETALPCLELEIVRGLTIGAGYEFGYDRTGHIGPYDYPTSFRMAGWNAFLGYEIRLEDVALFGQAGVGLYEYKQTVENPYVTDMPVNARKTGGMFAAGLKYYPLDVFFIGLEARYVLLKVKPYDSEVDLGGWRFAAGAGFAFGSRAP